MSIKRISQTWREAKDAEQQRFEAGEISEEERFMHQFFPDDFIARTDALLSTFASDIAALPSDAAAYPRIMAAIETLVLALNALKDDFAAQDLWVIETDERESLCACIDEVLIDAGVDIEALSAAQGCTRHELTDEWRDW